MPEAVANEQHPDHQLRIDRRPTRRAVERRQSAADVAKIDEPVDRPQQMIRRHVPFERELVEQRALRHLPRSHHRLRPPSLREDEISDQARRQAEFFNTIGAKRTYASVSLGLDRGRSRTILDDRI